jgi:hypothetical protein
VGTPGAGNGRLTEHRSSFSRSTNPAGDSADMVRSIWGDLGRAEPGTSRRATVVRWRRIPPRKARGRSLSQLHGCCTRLCNGALLWRASLTYSLYSCFSCNCTSPVVWLYYSFVCITQYAFRQFTRHSPRRKSTSLERIFFQRQEHAPGTVDLPSIYRQPRGVVAV